MKSLTNKTLLLLFSGGVFVAFVSAICVFLFGQHAGSEKASADLEGYANLVFSREVQRFEGVEQTLQQATFSLQNTAKTLVNDAPLTLQEATLFDLLFPLKADGTRRSHDQLFSGLLLPSGQFVSGIAAFIPGGETMAPARKKALLAAFQAMVATAGRADQELGNLFFVSSDADVLAYSPQDEKALMVYQRYAARDFDVFQSRFMTRPAMLSNKQSLSCSDLLRFSNDNLAVTCQVQTPFGNGQLGSFGMTLLSRRVYGDVFDHALRAIDVFLTSKSGVFLTSPAAAMDQRIEVVGEPLSAFDHASVNWLSNPAESQDSMLNTGWPAATEPSFFTTTRTLPAPAFKMVFTYPRALVLEEAFHQAASIFAAGIALTVCVCAIASIALRMSVSAPLKKLSQQADALARALKTRNQSAPDVALPSDRADEVGALARSFEALAETAIAGRDVQNK
ncbi:MAG: HAMP domain-containing protein, partial [Pseudomonadota bacterium]